MMNTHTKHTQTRTAARPSKPNVIQPPLDSTTSNPQAVNNMPTINSERPPFLAASIQQGSPKSPALPPWVPRLDLSRQQQQQQNKETVARNSTKLHCPEIVRRQIRWPSTEAGMFVQMPCPQHAQPGNLNDPYAASFACLPEGVWAPRGVQAARCQSLWLRNLTLRLEAGDSPLSMVAELVSRTAPFASLPGPLSSGFWFGQQQAAAPLPGLFGDDLVQLGRVVHRLVEETGLVLSRISDDKQRLAFGRDLVQVSRPTALYVVELFTLNQPRTENYSAPSAGADFQRGANLAIARVLNKPNKLLLRARIESNRIESSRVESNRIH